MLDYSAISDVITRVLTWGEGDMIVAETGEMCFECEGKNHKARNMGSYQKWKKAKKQILPSQSPIEPALPIP